MRHLMPIITPRLVLCPPTLGDLDSIHTAKEDAWPDLQRWMAWAFDNQRSRQATENSIRQTMDYQSQTGIALAGFHRINRDFVVRTMSPASSGCALPPRRLRGHVPRWCRTGSLARDPKHCGVSEDLSTSHHHGVPFT
jgi:hypothetical protein